MRYRNLPQKLSKRLPLLLGLCILILSTILRIAAMRNELWIDEVWSLFLSSKLQTGFGVFTQLHHDNNHYLNTLYLYLLGLHRPLVVYRIPSLVAGVGLVFLFLWHGARKSGASSVIHGLLIGFSYFSILLSSEARGYMPMLFFGFLSYLFLDSFLRTHHTRHALFFAACAIIAFLWQLLYLHFYLALLTWSLFVVWKKESYWDRWKYLALCHAPVIVFLLLLGFVDLQYMGIGGGPVHTLSSVLLEMVSLTFGTHGTFLTLVVSLFVLIVSVSRIEFLTRSQPDQAILYAMGVFGSALLWLLIFVPDYIFARYFIIPSFFLLLLSTELLSYLYHSHYKGKIACTLILLGFCTGSTLHTFDLLRFGRQSFTPALHYLLEQTPSSTLTIGGAQDFRTQLLLWFYLPRLKNDKDIHYFHNTDTVAHQPQWVLVERQYSSFPFPLHISRKGEDYTLTTDALAEDSFWLVYRKSDI